MSDKLSKKSALIIGLTTSYFVIAYILEFIQYLIFNLSNINSYSFQFYWIWLNVSLYKISKSPFLEIIASLFPIVLAIILIELSIIERIKKLFNSLSLLIFQLSILTYLMLKVIISSVLPLIIPDFYNDIYVVLKYYEITNAFKYLNVLFTVFAFLIYFNRISTRIIKNNNNKRGIDGKA